MNASARRTSNRIRFAVFAIFSLPAYDVSDSKDGVCLWVFFFFDGGLSEEAIETVVTNDCTDVLRDICLTRDICFEICFEIRSGESSIGF